MGIQNLEVNELLKRREIFADLVNGSLHHGRQVLKPEDLTPLPPQSGTVIDGRRGRQRSAEIHTGLSDQPDSGQGDRRTEKLPNMFTTDILYDKIQGR